MIKWKYAAQNLHKVHTEDELHPLYTPWGEKLDPDHVWEEYPRPQMKRANYRILNGSWDYRIIKMDSDDTRPGTPFHPDGRIVVPFSPESLLSGVGRQLMPDEYLWYQRVIRFQDDEAFKDQNRRCLLHFGAADQAAWVYVNGTLAVTHIGGYLPFYADITDFAKAGDCLIQVRVRDESDTSYHTRGKQTLKRGGMFYTAQSGLWQSVWSEWVPENPVISMKITPDFDNAAVDVELLSGRPFANIRITVRQPGIWKDTDEADLSLMSDPRRDKAKNTKVQIQTAGEPVRGKAGEKYIRTRLRIHFTNFLPGQTDFLPRQTDFLPWTPESPVLYPFTLQADNDRIDSYFGMRIFTLETGADGLLRFCLNHSPYFLHGLLDQGYWSDGLMTAPCDDAFLYDIELARSFGFNMLRKHIKIEPLRWYYHCDRMGMLVWQDMVSGGTTYHMPLVCYLPTIFPFIGFHTKDHHYRLFSRRQEEGRRAWVEECLETIEHLINVTSLSVWVPFNEGWGQFDAARIALTVKEKDPSRLVDHASGWFDQKGGDFRSIHNYFSNLKIKKDGKRAFVFSEYGGYAFHVHDHSSVDRIYGYRKYDNAESLTAAYISLLENQLMPLIEKGLSGGVYTQLSDVEEEVNGLVTYDRKVIKILAPVTQKDSPSDTALKADG